MKRVTLVNPPQFMPDIPQVTLPTLKAHLQKIGIETKVIDSNVEFYHWALSERTKQEDKNKITVPSLEEQSILLRQPFKIEDVSSYLSSRVAVETALDSFAQRFGGHLGLISSSLPYNYQHSEEVLAAVTDRSRNPHIEFFEKNLERIVTNTDIVGVTIGVPEQVIPAFTLMQLLRKHRPDIKILIGGNIYSRAQQEIETSPLRQLYDVGIYGEADIKLPQIVQALRAGENDLSRILSDTRVPNLSEEPIPDFTDLDLNLYFAPEPVLPVLGGRGCTYNKCHYCAITRMWADGGKFRGKSAEKVLEETVKQHDEHGVKLFKFIEESHNPRFAKDYTRLVIERGLPFKTEVFANLEPWILAQDAEHVGKVIAKIMYGYETSSAYTVQLTDKRTVKRASQTDAIFERAYQTGMAPFAFLMVGIPGESSGEALRTADDLIRQPAIKNHVLSVYSLDKWAPDALDKDLQDKKGLSDVQLQGDLAMSHSYKIRGASQTEANRIVAAGILKKINQERPDLALMSAFQPAARFYLFSKYGPDVAVNYLKQNQIPQVAETLANESYLRARIERTK